MSGCGKDRRKRVIKLEEPNEEESNIYHSTYREDMVDDDEIDSNEAGFMDGYTKELNEEKDEVV